VAGSHGLSCFRDEGQKRRLLPGFKELNLMVDAQANESIYKYSHPDALMCLVGAVTAAVPATSASSKVIRRGKNDISVVVQIEVPFVSSGTTGGQGAPNFGEDGLGIVHLAGNSRDRFQTGTAQARRLKTTRRQTT
jgi:hypothetical protein